MTNIFVAGIAGSGKTTLCKALARDLPARHIAVGQLACAITDGWATSAASVEKTDAAALDRCQRLLTVQFAEDLKQAPAEEIWVLDGHLVLAGCGRAPFEVPAGVLRAAGVGVVILCDTPPSEVARRIGADPRPRANALRTSLAERSEAERRRARELAHDNGWQLTRWDGLTPFSFDELPQRVSA